MSTSFNGRAGGLTPAATVKRECLNYFVCFSLAHLNHIAQEYIRYYDQDQPHQGVGNRPLNF